MILFKAKAYLDLKRRKENGENVDVSDVRKHKKDILRITAEIVLETVSDLPCSIQEDISAFIDSLEQEPFDRNLLKEYGLSNEMAVELLKRVYR